MSDNTGIQWTDATWNPIRGCSRVSSGCQRCYAETVARRFSGSGLPYEGLTTNGRWNGTIRVVEEHLLDPLRWRRPRRVFVNSMSDLFHENVADETIDRIFAVMALAPRHTFQVLTKRPERMRDYLCDTNPGTVRLGMRISRAVAALTPKAAAPRGRAAEREWDEHADAVAERTWRMEDPFVLPNVWLGVSVEDQATADARIPLLLETPAAVRFISAEPLLGPINLARLDVIGQADKWPHVSLNALDGLIAGMDEYHDSRGLDWVIVGGESGPGARPCDVAWVRSIVEQCAAAGVACFVKQLGADVRDRNDAGFMGDEADHWPEEHSERNAIEHDLDGTRDGYQGAPVRIHLRDRKGGDMAEWPEGLRVRQFPVASH